MADVYTHGHHDSVLRAHRWRTAENSAAYLLGYLQAGLSLLDVGCGPATLTADLARRVAPGRVVGIDAAESVLVEARRTVDELDNVDVQVGDVYDLDFPDATFDVVHAHQVLQHLSDPVAALREMARVCRPDGVVAVREADYGAMTWWPNLPALDRWMEIYRGVARSNRAQPDAGRRLLAWANAAGLSDLASSASVWCFATPDDRRWWGDLWAERTTTSAFARQAEDYGVARAAELAAVAAGWREWAGTPNGWFAVLHGEIVGRPG